MHITPVLQSFYWLLISCCVQFNILVCTSKALNSLGSAYLQNYLFCYVLLRQFCLFEQSFLWQLPRKWAISIIVSIYVLSVVTSTLQNDLPEKVMKVLTLLSLHRMCRTKTIKKRDKNYSITEQSFIRE